MPTWIDAGPLEALPPGSARRLRHEQIEVALFRLDDGGLRAVDNRCPHEGYPLVQGLLAPGEGGRCVLTCAWHNWKFDLADGANLRGGEDVRTHAVRVRDGRIEVDTSPPEPEVEVARLQRSLETALGERDTGRACRDATRLLMLDVSPAAIAAQAAGFDGRHARYGATHALPVAADVLRLLDGERGPQAVIALAQVLDLAGVAGQRRPARAAAAPADLDALGLSDPVAAGDALATHVEAEDFSSAEAILRAALARGWRTEVLRPWFLRLCADHFLSFGHRLIYTVKAFELLDAADWAHAEPVLSGLLFGIVGGTREDLLPGWRAWNRRVDTLDLAALDEVAEDRTWAGRGAVVAALVDGRSHEALDAVITAREAGAPLSALCDALSLGAAERLLRFEVAHDLDPGVQDSWLSVTHTATFAAAVRQALGLWSDPRRLRLVLQAARFVHHHRVLDGARPDTTPQVGGTAGDVLAAVAAGDAAAAIRLAGALPDGLGDALRARCLEDVAGQPIVQAHLLKNTLIAFDEAAATGDPRPVQAVVRLWASPLRERRVAQRAAEALAFVTEGRKPRLLAP